MSRGFFVAVAALAVTGGAAFAQSAEEELQRCIFRCLYNSPGAESPEYNQCVETQCVAQDSQSSSVWQSTQLFPDNPPYLDGRVASASTNDGALSISYLCGRDGDSSMLLDGQVLRSTPVLNGREHSIRFVVDGVSTHWLGGSEYEGALYVAVTQTHPLLQAMMGGSTLNIDMPGYSTTASLQGSADAIGGALSYCR